MRPLRLGVALLATSGLAGCASALPGPEAGAPLPLAEAVRGAWVAADSVRVTRTHADEGADESDPYVQWTFVYLHRHIEVADSVATISSVWKNVVEFVGVEDMHTTRSVPFGARWTYPVRLDSGRISLGERSELVLLPEDHLGVVTAYADGGIDTVAYRRGEPLGVPSGLMGTWTGSIPRSSSGTPRQIDVRFTQSTAEMQGGDEKTVVALGPYLILGDPSPADEYEGDVTYYNADPFTPATPFRLIGDSLVMGPENEEIAFRRQPD